MRNHRNLKAFQLAEELALEVYRHTARYPRHEMFGLVSRMRRSAISVAANIVEGAARESQLEFLRFLQISFGSLKELGFLIEVSQKLSFLNGHTASPLLELQDETARVLAGLIKALRTTSEPARQ